MTEIEKLRQREPETVERLYLSYKSSFLQFASKYPLSREDLLDIYQDAFVAMMENADKGRLDNLKSELKTYVFSIGKYMIFSRLKKPLTYDLENLHENFEFEDPSNSEELVLRLEQKLGQLGEQCYRILRMFYYENLKLDEILERSSYQSKDVLKSQKARCIKQLKEMLQKN